MNEELNIKDWPDCPISGCKAKVCLSLNSDKCFPHTRGDLDLKYNLISKAQSREEINERNMNEHFNKLTYLADQFIYSPIEI